VGYQRQDNYNRQVCLIKVGAKLFRKVDLVGLELRMGIQNDLCHTGHSELSY